MMRPSSSTPTSSQPKPSSLRFARQTTASTRSRSDNEPASSPLNSTATVSPCRISDFRVSAVKSIVLRLPATYRIPSAIATADRHYLYSIGIGPGPFAFPLPIIPCAGAKVHRFGELGPNWVRANNSGAQPSPLGLALAKPVQQRPGTIARTAASPPDAASGVSPVHDDTTPWPTSSQRGLRTASAGDLR